MIIGAILCALWSVLDPRGNSISQRIYVKALAADYMCFNGCKQRFSGINIKNSFIQTSNQYHYVDIFWDILRNNIKKWHNDKI